MSKRLLSIEDAAAFGVQRLRKPIWANPLDHVKIDIIDGKPGPWLHLWCPFNKECNGRDPVDVFAYQWNLSVPEFELYDGPLPSSEEYQKAVERFDGVLQQEKKHGD
jgi:hypothetical protein